MSTADWNIDWTAIAASLPPEQPDAYHSRLKAGATKHPIGFGLYQVPAGNETPWDTFDAYCWYCAHPWDYYHFETVVLSYARSVHEIAADFLDKRKGRFREIYSKKQVDTFGMDLFGEGLLGVVEAVRQRPKFGDIGPDDKDEMEQLKQYICGTARNKMVDYFNKMYPKWWCNSIRQTSDNGELLNDHGEVLLNKQDAPAQLIATESSTPEAEEAAHLRAVAAVENACANETDKAIVELRQQGDLSQEEIGKQVGLSRDQVQRRLDQIQKTVEDVLGLKHVRAAKRKRRKAGAPSPSTDEQASAALTANLAG